MRMNEREFDNLIDCRFPYQNVSKAKKLAKLGCAISANTGFQVAHELARVPRFAKASKKIEKKFCLNYTFILNIRLKGKY